MAHAFKLWRSEKGSAGVLFALSAVPLVAFAGGAVDLAKQSRFETVLQSALDAAALGAARDVGNQITARGGDQVDYSQAEQRAEQIFQAAITPFGETMELAISHDQTRIIVSSEWPMPTAFLSVIGLRNLNVSGHAEADIEIATETCVYATAEDDEGIALKSSSEFRANCQVRVESASDRSISATASSDMTATEICSNGETFLWATSTVTPAPVPCHQDYLDPLGHLAQPKGASVPCDFNDLTLKGQVRLRPGVYCGTTTIAPASHAILEMGEYTFRDGKLEIGSGSSAFGEDMLLYFQGAHSGLIVGDGSRFEGHGRLEGDFKGLVVYVDRDCFSCSNLVEAGGRAEIEGTVYAPTAPFTVRSRASAVGAFQAFFIVHRLSLESSASFTVERGGGAGGVPVAFADEIVVRMVK